METCIPRATTPPTINLPWLSKDLKRLMKKRNAAYHQAKRGNNLQHLEKYNQLRNLVLTKTRRAKRLFFRKLAILSPNKKQYWKTVKLLTRSCSTILSLITDEGSEVTDDDGKADALNSFFSKCFNRKENPLTNSDWESVTSPSPECPEEYLCTEQQVFDLLSTLDVSKSTGPDGISAKMLKATASGK